MDRTGQMNQNRFVGSCNGLNEEENLVPGLWCCLARLEQCGLPGGSMSQEVDFEVSKHCVLLPASCL